MEMNNRISRLEEQMKNFAAQNQFLVGIIQQKEYCELINSLFYVIDSNSFQRHELESLKRTFLYAEMRTEETIFVRNIVHLYS